MKRPWGQFKALRKLEGISEKEIFEVIEKDRPLHRQQFFNPALGMYSLVHVVLMFICQSC